MNAARARKLWEGQVGFEPHVVWYGERADKGLRVYLRWRVGPKGKRNWRWQSLGFTVRDARGRIDEQKAREAHERATIKYGELTGELLSVDQRASGPMRLIDTWPILTDRATGKFPSPSVYRDELLHALTFARRVLGDDFPWLAFDHLAMQKVIRAKADSVVAAERQRKDDDTRPPRHGLRAAEVIGTRLLSIATLLRDRHKLIPMQTPLPAGRQWREELKRYVAHLHGGRLPEVQRPRHELDEVRRILAVAIDIDPRLDLAIQLGAEYRSGQVLRGRRTDLELTGAIASFKVHGSGRKQGSTVELTTGQRDAVERAFGGYLSDLEAAYQAGTITDYLLFPQGRMVRGKAKVRPFAEQRPINKTSMGDRFRAAEERAGVQHVPGRAFYGMRRQLLDAAAEAGISTEGMLEHGGWGDERTPRSIYRDRNRPKARKEAADIRAQIRGEPANRVPETYPARQTTPNPSPATNDDATT